MTKKDREFSAGRQVALACEAPTADALTEYDEAHFAVYLSLLHANAQGAGDAKMCREILGIDAAADPERAAKMLRSHLDRARWLSSEGRQRILES